jgi:transposase
VKEDHRHADTFSWHRPWQDDLVAVGTASKVLARNKFTQKQLLAYTANMQTSLIGLEAGSGAHFLGRAPRKQGHDVRLIPAQFVKPS